MSFPEGASPEEAFRKGFIPPADDEAADAADVGGEARVGDGLSEGEGEGVGEKDEEGAAQRGDAAVNGGGNGSSGAPGAALAEEADAREVLARERGEYLRALQQTQADFENYRKRIARLQEEQSARAAADLVTKLLPVLDTLDLAEAHLNESLDVSEDGKALRASRAMLMDILSREGLERMDQAEVPFDPSVHDAVAHSPGDPGGNGETIVEEVLRPGYRWKGQELRAAMVRVRG
jgi:molecular chaperone GrpE